MTLAGLKKIQLRANFILSTYIRTALGSILKDDQIVKVVKRLKKMVRIVCPYVVYYLFFAHFSLSQGKDSCPCCTRDFNHVNELKTFTNRMVELVDADTSELIRSNQVLAKLEVSFSMS